MPLPVVDVGFAVDAAPSVVRYGQACAGEFEGIGAGRPPSQRRT